jgi:hypothetical protein
MRWSIENGQNLLSLIAKDKSGLWEKDVVQPVLAHFKAEGRMRKYG